MDISQTTTAIMVFLTGLLPASCHKNTSKANATPSAIVATNATSVRNLGEIILTNANETCLQLADGKHCLLTPKLIDAKNFRLTVAVEAPNANGETEEFSVSQITGSPGKTLELAIGNLNLVFTPRIVDNRAK